MTKALPPKHIVLYADDDPDDIMLIKDAFDSYKNHIDIVTASNGFETLSYLQKLNSLQTLPCLIILDVNMPLLNGKETLREIRTMDRFKEVPVILFTTSSVEADKVYAQKYGAGFITKPLDVRQMVTITDQFIAHCAEDVKKKIRKQIK